MRLFLAPLAAILAIASLATSGCAQSPHDHGARVPARVPAPAGDGRVGAAADTADVRAAAAVHEAMSDPLMAAHASHIVLTPTRPATAADSARAARVLTELKRGLARYADVRAAEADGYRQFLPNVPQKVYHFTSYRRSVGEAFAFDPARPSSLLYEKTPDGRFTLVGAMYHAPRRLSLEQLDERVPLGIARWHRHVNLCLPPRGEEGRWRETRGGVPLFGPLGSIATRGDCDAAGGRFVENLFGWMLHVNPFASDPAEVWGSNTHDMEH
jgi:hypothetical protein